MMIAAYQDKVVFDYTNNTVIGKYENITNVCTNKSMQVCEPNISFFDRQRSKMNITLQRI